MRENKNSLNFKFTHKSTASLLYSGHLEHKRDVFLRGRVRQEVGSNSLLSSSTRQLYTNEAYHRTKYDLHVPYALNLTERESAVLGGWRYPFAWGPFSINILHQVVYLYSSVIVILLWTTGTLFVNLTSFCPMVFLYMILVSYYGFFGTREIWYQTHNFENGELRSIIYISLLAWILLFGALGVTNILIGLCSEICITEDIVPFCEHEITVWLNFTLGDQEDLQRIFCAIILWFSAIFLYIIGAVLQTIILGPQSSRFAVLVQVVQIVIWFLGFILKHFALWLFILFVVEWVIFLNSSTLSGVAIYNMSMWPFHNEVRELITDWSLLIASSCGWLVLESYLTVSPISLFKSLYYILFYYRKISELVNKVFCRNGSWFRRVVLSLLLFGVFINYVFLLICFIYPFVVTPTAGILVKIITDCAFLQIDPTFITIRTQVFTFWGYYTILSVPGLILFLRPLYVVSHNLFAGTTPRKWSFESSSWFPEAGSFFVTTLGRNNIILVFISSNWHHEEVLAKEWSSYSVTQFMLTPERKTLLAEFPIYLYSPRTGNCHLNFAEWGLAPLPRGVLFAFDITKPLPDTLILRG